MPQIQHMAEIRRRVETIEAALMRTLDLLEMMVLDLRKAQTLLSSLDGRHDFILKSKRKIP